MSVNDNPYLQPTSTELVETKQTAIIDPATGSRFLTAQTATTASLDEHGNRQLGTQEVQILAGDGRVITKESEIFRCACNATITKFSVEFCQRCARPSCKAHTHRVKTETWCHPCWYPKRWRLRLKEVAQWLRS